MIEDFWQIAAVGFAAQMFDGALGMAYGLTSTSLLLTLGYSPAAASAAVHLAETATTAVSAGSHHLARNVDWKLVRPLCNHRPNSEFHAMPRCGVPIRPFGSSYSAGCIMDIGDAGQSGLQMLPRCS
ncbi:TSUP family transporter [Roseivivax sediminis]|uniref:Probable membrane transporter protein n=1 Tax=Roseivivax sediminis TaxID=936889 RepID=A0A1I2CPS5_9RHOB|nr:Sulfite exporter TauE/SafE [Roseivivax sediminis]